MGTSTRATRAASLGLAVVVLCLAGFSTWAAYTTQTRVELAQRSTALHESYDHATSAKSDEELAELQYLLEPSPEHLAALGNANEAFIAAVDRIAEHGGQDAQLAMNLLVFHDQYLTVLERMLGAMATGDIDQARRIEEEEGEPLFNSMDALLTAAAEERGTEAESTYADLDRTATWMLLAAPAAFAIGFVLLLGLWRILERHHRATRDTYLEIEQLSRLRGEFVSTVSHEFRTPLTGIQGFSEMMRDEELTLAQMREYAGDINKDAQRLARLISDMLDLDRMESGQMTLNTEQVDLNRILADTAAQFRLGTGKHPIQLDLDPALPKLTGDSDRLTQVVTNLLSNAIKYSPAGGAVELRTKGDERTVLLTVRDHGIGIPPEDLETIFKRYSRIESTATRGVQGTGLGLPIVRQIVQLYEGKVWATSESGAGSVFHVQLPLIASTVPLPRRLDVSD